MEKFMNKDIPAPSVMPIDRETWAGEEGLQDSRTACESGRSYQERYEIAGFKMNTRFA